MNQTISSTNPVGLSDDELGFLDAFLLSDRCHDEALPVDELHGYLTALRVGSVTPSLEDILPHLWGEPTFVDAAERNLYTDLIQRLYRDIGDQLQQGRGIDPLLVETEEGSEAYESCIGWCYGFMSGVEAQEENWEDLDKEGLSLLAPMAQLAMLYDDEEADMDEEEYVGWEELIPGAVLALYRRWHRPGVITG